MTARHRAPQIAPGARRGGGPFLPGGAVDGMQEHLVRGREGGAEAGQQRPGAGDGVAHEVRHQAAPGIERAQTGERGGQLGGVVRVVVQDQDAAALADHFGAPLAAAVGRQGAFHDAPRRPIQRAPLRFEQPDGDRHRGGGVGGVVAPGDAQGERVRQAPQAEAGGAGGQGHALDPKRAGGALAVGAQPQVGAAPGRLGRHLRGAGVVGAVDEAAPGRQRDGEPDERRHHRGVGGERVHVLQLHRRDHQVAGVKVGKVVAVLAGLRHQVVGAALQGRGAAEVGDAGGGEHGGGKLQGLHQQAAQGRGGGLAVDPGNRHRGHRAGQFAERFGVAGERDSARRGGHELRVRVPLVGRRVNHPVSVRRQIGGGEAVARAQPQAVENLLRLERFGYVGAAQQRAARGQNLGQRRHPRTLGAYQVNAPSADRQPRHTFNIGTAADRRGRGQRGGRRGGSTSPRGVEPLLPG